MKSEFSQRKPHLTDIQRRHRLAEIEGKLQESPFPPQLVVENTSYCNLKCIHCSHPEMIRKPQHMERTLWDKIMKEVASEMPDCEVWPTFYGEALILKQELWDRLNYADKLGCTNLVLNSNGTLLDRWGNIEAILDSPLKRFILSLDGASPETFEKIRFKAKFDTVYPAVEKLLELHAKRNQTYPVISVQFSVMEDNAHEVEAFREHWKKFGAEVKVRPMLEWGAVGSIRTDTIVHDDPFRIACPWGNNTAAVHADGSVVACAIDYDANYTVGNLNEITLKEAWQRLGEGLRRPHREHRWDDIPEICRGCGDWQVAGAEYEETEINGVRPFWFDEEKREDTQ